MVRRKTSKPSVLEDQYYASPKRKDCKVDCAADAITKTGKATKSDSNSSKAIGVPLATRSQTKTIENFFKSQTADSNITEIDLNSDSDTEESLPSPPLPCMLVTDIKSSERDIALTHSQNGYIFNLSDDTNEDNETETETSDETKSNGLSEIDFAIVSTKQRSIALDDSYSSRSNANTQTDNIFLQEPVLTLNIDKTLNQASSIKINKSIEIEPVFSSPPSSLAASALHGRFNQIVSLNGCLNDMTSANKNLVISPKLNGYFILLPENDNSSCDSGLGLIPSTLEQHNYNNNNNNEKSNKSPLAGSPFVCNSQGATRRRKPATPHRILCPSPTKAAPRTVTHTGRVISPTPGRKKDHLLSPRKSPRHLNNAATVTLKSRRRLNPPQVQESGKTPYKLETTKTVVQNGFEQMNGIIDLCTGAQDDDDDVIEIETTPKDGCANINKNKSEITVQKFETKPTNFPPETTKPIAVVGKTKNQQQLLPPKTTSSSSSSSSSKGTKSKSTTNKNHPTPHPLGSTNNSGNRELTQFFPVRRSVRKTKTVVKEEMMRSLEQAVLEERADGLKIAHFDGKGRGVIADRRFQRGEFVVEYVGDLISMTEATEREKQYALDENAGCYMYYFKHKNQQYCIDATVDTGKLGRLVNHSRNGNLLTKVVVVKQRPHLVLLAKDDILSGEELTYDYGDRSKESLLHHPWLAF